MNLEDTMRFWGNSYTSNNKTDYEAMKEQLEINKEYEATVEAAKKWYENRITSTIAPDYDKVNKPKHYMLFEDLGIEVRDVIAKLIRKIEDSEFIFDGVDYADYTQMMQYLMRFMDKGGVEDMKKARFYLNALITSYDNDA